MIVPIEFLVPIRRRRFGHRMGMSMPLTDTKLKNLKAQAKPYQEADSGGLFVEVTPKGMKVWRLRYRLAGKQEKVGVPWRVGRRRTARCSCSCAGRSR